MLNFLKRKIKFFLDFYPKWLCKHEFEHQIFARFNERPVEYGFVFKCLLKIYPQKILDVGTGTTALPHLMRNCGFMITAIDNVKDFWPSGMVNRHYHVINDDIRDPKLSETFDAITCISALEHIRESGEAITNLFRLLNTNGYLILSFPYSERNYIDNVYKLPGSRYGQDFPFICQSYSRQELNAWLHENNGRIIEQEYWQFWDGPYWTVGHQLIPPMQVGQKDNHQLTCLLIQK